MKLFGNWSYPTTIKLGAGRIKELGEASKQLGIKKPLFVTDKGLSHLPIVANALEVLASEKCTAVKFDEVDPNPTENNLVAGIETFKKHHCDGVIAFGGGSGLDLGKLIAFMVGQTRPVWDFEDIGDWWTRANHDAIMPIIAVPTTAGTGSEVGRASVLTNSQTHVKKIIFHPKILPSIVIADPELTINMPLAITAGTGMDAFAHCLEAFCSPHYHPMCHGIALEGMRLVKDNLRRVYADGSDIEARTHMMVAASMGATAFQKGLGAIHAISHPVGSVYNAHHGTTNAVVMPPVLKFNRSAIESKIEQASNYLGIVGGFNGFYDEVLALRQDLAIPKNIADLGVSLHDIDRLAVMALEDPSCGGNPIPLTKENITSLLVACINGE